MGNSLATCPCRRRRVAAVKDITLLLIGLDDAGKTCTTKHLLEESTADAVPTVGFTNVKIKQGKYNVCIYDLGGGPKIRGIWKNYYALVHGVIFVVDASEPRRFEECRTEIQKVIKDPRIAGKPILLLFNKQDVEGAVSEMELVSQLDLEALVNAHHCPTRVEASCALYEEQKIKDPGIEEGFRWLVAHIGRDYLSLSNRVAQEKADQMKQEEKERLERLERVRKIRAEREEAERRKQQVENFVATEHDDDDDDDVIVGNPFRPVEQIKRELENRKKSGRQNTENAPGITVVHVSPRNSTGCKEEIILQPRLAQSRMESTAMPSNQDERKVIDHCGSEQNQPSSSVINRSAKEKNRCKKPKKRFKNRIVPQVHQPLGVLNAAAASSGSDLPPLLPARDVNGHISTLSSPTKQQNLLNGQVNWAIAEELTPSAVYTVPRQAKADL